MIDDSFEPTLVALLTNVVEALKSRRWIPVSMGQCGASCRTATASVFAVMSLASFASCPFTIAAK